MLKNNRNVLYLISTVCMLLVTSTVCYSETLSCDQIYSTEKVNKQHDISLSILLEFEKTISEKSNDLTADIPPPAFASSDSTREIIALLKTNPNIKDAIAKLDFDKINLKDFARSHPALFQITLHEVLESNYSIGIMVKFIDAIPVQWLKYLIGRSFLLDKSKNPMIRKLSELLLQLGSHDEYTREHSIMVAVWALKLYSEISKSSESMKKILYKFDYVGHSIKKPMLISDNSLQVLLQNKNFKLNPIIHQQVNIVNLKLSLDQARTPLSLISKLSPSAQTLFNSTNAKLKNVNWLPRLREGESYPETIDKILLLSDVNDLKVLENLKISYEHIRNESPMFMFDIEFDYDKFMHEYGSTILAGKDDAIELLFWASASHDLGKKEVVLDVLNKKGGHDPEERAVMRAHPLASFATQLNIFGQDSPDLAIALIGFLHHEESDGSGYPLGLTKIQTPLFVRILSLVDAFHAMTSDRPYRKGMPYQQALEILRKDELLNNSGQWDSNLVDLFSKMVLLDPR